MSVRERPRLEDATALPPAFAAWFASRGWSPRPFQLALVEAGAKGQSVLLTAPTGGGKTLAGFLPSLIELANAAPPPPPLTRRSPSPAKAVEEEMRRRSSSTALAGEGDHREAMVEGGSNSAYVNPVIARLKAKAAARPRGVHTLYVSPLKALAVDIARNLDAPAKEMGLPVKIETRTGDTSAHRRLRQRHSPPDILLTTPEQIALLLATGDTQRMFGNLRCVILDELHALAPSKRGDLLALDLARLSVIAPGHRRVGLSATVHDPDILARYLVPQVRGEERRAVHIKGAPGAKPNVSILASDEDVPWAGHMARHALMDILRQIKTAKTALVFVNTRMQAEFLFQQLWAINDENLPIALHHGSLSPEQRRKVEGAMAKGSLRGVVCTSTLDLGIDWGAVDLVINVGAPKGASRIAQRIGRSNHRMNEPSRALLVPANRFEVLECEAARDALMHGELDGEKPRHGSLDVLCQHVLGMAVAAPFDADALYAEVISASPYRDLPRKEFDRVLDFVATGGYALRAYERYAKLKKTPEGLWRVATPQIAQRYRLNAGTIVEAPMLKVRVVRNYRGPRIKYTGRILGQVEEWFLQQLRQGDTFLFAGQILRFEGVVETEAIVTPGPPGNPMIPSFEGGKFPLSTFLAARVREMIADPKRWRFLPDQVKEWLGIQRIRSLLPRADQMLVETFPRGKRHYLVCYPFDGRLCHQSLGMLLTRRLERIGAKPLGFVASEYSLALWALAPMHHLDMNRLFDEDMLGDDLDAWLAELALLKRSFRQCAVIAGLIEKRNPAEEKSGRQVTFSSDLIYDVLRGHQPDHILLQAAFEDAAAFALDITRLGDLLRRIKGNIVLKRLERVSPLAVPALLDIGKVPVGMDANEALLAEASEDLIAEAMKVD